MRNRGIIKCGKYMDVELLENALKFSEKVLD